jgi:NTE family protein
MQAICFSGGGAKGSYAVGVCKHLLGNLKKTYDVFSGVSVGAINASFLAMFPTGQEELAANQLYEMWSKLSTKDIYKRWFPFGSFHGLWKSSLYNSEPLRDLIRKNINLDRIRASGKVVVIGAISLSSGKYTVFDQTSDYLIEAVIASASFPGLLAPVKIGDEWWIDAGPKKMLPTNSMIDMGVDKIDLVITSPEKRIPKYFGKPSAIDALRFSFDFANDKILSNDIERLEMYNTLAAAGLSGKKVIGINVIRPTYNLTDDSMDFSNEKIREMMKIGYEDARRMF